MAGPLAASFRDRRGENSSELGAALNNAIWGLPADTKSAFYLQRYNALSATVRTSSLPFATHNDVVDLINLIKTGRQRSFRDLRTDISGRNPAWLANNSDATLRSAVKFAASLWLMVDVSLWNDNESLCDFVQATWLANPAANPDDDEIAFDARTLSAIGGIDIVWTSRLNEHLLMNKRNLQLRVFRHASFLGQRQNTGQDQVYPPGFLRETAETMAVLFPPVQSSYRRFSREVRKKADVDVEIGIATDVSLNFDHYVYWRDRLETIKSTYDKISPNYLSQWMHDRRDGNRYWMFWLTVVAIILTLLFGLIQSVTGLISIIKS